MGISTATHSCAKLNNNRKVRRQNKRRGCGLKIKSNKKFMKRGGIIIIHFYVWLGGKNFFLFFLFLPFEIKAAFQRSTIEKCHGQGDVLFAVS